MRRAFILSRFIISILALGVLSVNSARAKENPCREIVKTCREEGYANGGRRSSGLGVVQDCLQKLIAGHTLPGVQVSFEALSSCKTRWLAQQRDKTGQSQEAQASNPGASRRLASDSAPVEFHLTDPATGPSEKASMSSPH